MQRRPPLSFIRTPCTSSSRVRQAAYESIMRVYLIGNHGDGFQTVGWLVERLSPTSDMFEASASSRRVIVDILLKIINGGIADSAFKEILLSDNEILHNGEKNRAEEGIC